MSENTEHTLILIVEDSGIGMTQEQLAHIFDRFYQADTSSTRKGEGTGIGLSLTKGLVHLMKGNIRVESSKNQGSTFTITLPLLKVVQNGHVTTGSQFVFSNGHEIVNRSNSSSTVQNSFTSSEQNNPDKDIILIIEDHPELRSFIRSSMQESYQVIEASNGKEGIDKAIAIVPDLVLSDVMMPEADGYEVLKALKEHEATSHIPIILLSAKSAIEDRLRGLGIGADDYLTKPFHEEELRLKIRNLIGMRRHIQQKFSFSNLKISGGTNQSSSSKENEFLRKITAKIEQGISDTNLSVMTLTEHVFMSRSQLYRKIKSLTGQSPNEFIRNYRLDRALEMIKNKEGSIAQIADKVGFGDEKYFSTRFKERFSLSPSEVN